MEILNNAIVENRELYVGQNWIVQNSGTLYLKELFSIEDCIYVCLMLDNKLIKNVVRSRNGEIQILESNRNIFLAKKFVMDYSFLFD